MATDHLIRLNELGILLLQNCKFLECLRKRLWIKNDITDAKDGQGRRRRQ
jgi:hypothetical protein